MTEQPQEAITRAQADDVCEQWELELGADGPTCLCAWQHADELFRHHKYPSWLATHYFVARADGVPALPGTLNCHREQHAALKARPLKHL